MKLKALERRKFGKNSPIRVAVVGCGYSGVELAATISERLQDKGIVEAINVDKTVLPNAPTGNREAALKVSRFSILCKLILKVVLLFPNIICLFNYNFKQKLINRKYIIPLPHLILFRMLITSASFLIK